MRQWEESSRFKCVVSLSDAYDGDLYIDDDSFDEQQRQPMSYLFRAHLCAFQSPWHLHFTLLSPLAAFVLPVPPLLLVVTALLLSPTCIHCSSWFAPFLLRSLASSCLALRLHGSNPAPSASLTPAE